MQRAASLPSCWQGHSRPSCLFVGVKLHMQPCHLFSRTSHYVSRSNCAPFLRPQLPLSVPKAQSSPDSVPHQQQPANNQPHSFITKCIRSLGAFSIVFVAMLAASARPAMAKDLPDTTNTAPIATVYPRARYTGIDLAEASTNNPSTSTTTTTTPQEGPATTSTYMPGLPSNFPGADLQRFFNEERERFNTQFPEKANDPKAFADHLASLKGVPLDYDELMRSSVYNPAEVPVRHMRHEIQDLLRTIKHQYDDEEDFQAGLKQYIVEQKVEDAMEDEEADHRGGGKADLEDRIAKEMQGPEETEEEIKTADVGDDPWSTEVAEEWITAFGEPSSLKSAWRVQDTLREVSYTQFWALVGEGHVDRVRFYGVEQKAALVQLKSSAPGGVRVIKVVVPPDPDLRLHLAQHGISPELPTVDRSALGTAFTIQLLRFTTPFMFIAAVFWLLHTWILEPPTTKFGRLEFIMNRRSIAALATKLNYRSPARLVRINTASEDFIPWDEIHGIDDVKLEIQEIIDYLKNPSLLRLRGVTRIGGVMLAGAPGTGKTLLAKAIAAESGVRMFTCSGTDFYDVYAGVGSRRIRETFEKMRQMAPAILFIDEFDALGAARGGGGGGDESGNIINEMLVQLDGFDDNRGVVVLGATNRPGAIDSALLRQGRFDRVIYMPLPDAEGRSKIMQVHGRGKAVSKDINWYEVSRSISGYTGADCMGLMQRAARMAARQGKEVIEEQDIFAAMEARSVEAYSDNTAMPEPGFDDGIPSNIPLSLKKSIAVYEAAKALLAYVTPGHDEIARVSVCPYNILTGYTLFVEEEDKEDQQEIQWSRADMEGRMVVFLAGRCAEKLVLGESEVTGLGVPDMYHANLIAREMVLMNGMGRKTGPMELMNLVPIPHEDHGNMLKRRGTEDAAYFYSVNEMSLETSRTALSEVIELLEAAEAKAYYALTINWKPFQALVEALLKEGVLQGREVEHVLETNGVISFEDPDLQGFGWNDVGELMYPQKVQPDETAPSADGMATKSWPEAESASTSSAAKSPPSSTDDRYKYGWHWNMPHTIQRDYPDWYRKELERYMS